MSDTTKLRGLYCKTASEVDALIDAAIERQGGQVE